jgi:hypothetical protein
LLPSSPNRAPCTGSACAGRITIASSTAFDLFDALELHITGPKEKYLEAYSMVEVLEEARHGGGSLGARGTPDPLFSAVKAMLRHHRQRKGMGVERQGPYTGAGLAARDAVPGRDADVRRIDTRPPLELWPAVRPGVASLGSRS